MHRHCPSSGPPEDPAPSAPSLGERMGGFLSKGQSGRDRRASPGQGGRKKTPREGEGEEGECDGGWLVACSQG